MNNIKQIGLRVPKQTLINAIRMSNDNRVHIIVDINEKTGFGTLTVQDRVTTTSVAIASK